MARTPIPKEPKVKVQKAPRWRLTNAQRAAIKLAKVNRSATKSAISEIGRTAREMTASIAASRTAQKLSANKTAERTMGYLDTNSTVNRGLEIYNRIIDGNADKTGNNQDDSTTEVGGGGSYLGG